MDRLRVLRCCLMSLSVAGVGCKAQQAAPSLEPPVPLEVLDVEVLHNPMMANDVSVLVTPSVPASLVVECRSTVDSLEHHVVEVSTAPHHVVPLQGLLADSAYDCDVTVVDSATGESIDASVAFDTDPLPVEIPVMVASHPTGEPERSIGGYTVFNHWTQDGDPKVQKLVMVDPDGAVRWYYVLEKEVSVGVEVNHAGGGLMLAAGGRGYNPSFIDLSGELLYESPDPVSGGVYHHHAELLPSGDILSMASADNTVGGVVWEGFVLETRQAWTGALTWSWDSQRAVDAGTLGVGTSDDQDVYHANAVAPVTDDDGDAYYVNLRNDHQLLRIDAVTGAIDWKLGAGGDFQLVDMAGNPLDDELWFYGQHDPEIDFPYVLVHDNGDGRPGDDYTRAIELRLDVEDRTATLQWSYEEPGWSEPIWGDVDALSNGNRLISQGHCYDCAGVDPKRRTSVIEVDPRDDAVVWRLDFFDERDGLYRADHVDACAVFSNRRFCG